ncbi:MAG: hypothetical protein OXU20_01930 [Myxococcales bacterium]|nr:hypothetical protein [Myxococcales bacterium]
MKYVLEEWRQSLATLLAFYEARRGPLLPFVAKLFALSVVLNATCYWVGILGAYPEKLLGHERGHYVLLQIPVGLLGAVFDTASFFVTVAIIRRALSTRHAREYLAHLSIDVGVAVLATFWVLFVFTASGWIMSYLEMQPESLGVRTAKYEHRLLNALRDPAANWRNVYFGVVMGVSASLPTLLHLGMFARAWLRSSVVLGDRVG